MTDQTVVSTAVAGDGSAGGIVGQMDGLVVPRFAGDVLDPAFAPGTGTPETAGLNSRELFRLIRGLAGARLVGADVVEVAPSYDHAEVTGVAAASLAYEFVCLFAREGAR